MTMPVTEYGDPYAITNASTSIPVADGAVLGIVVSTSTSGTLSITDAKGRAITAVMPLAAGSFVPLKAKFIGPLTLSGGGTFAACLIVSDKV